MKKIFILFMFLLILTTQITFSESTDDNIEGNIVENIEKEQKDQKQEQINILKEELKERMTSINSLKKDLNKILKEIGNIDSELIKTLDNDNIVKLKKEKSNLTLEKVNIILKINEHEIRAANINKEIKIIKEDEFILANGKLNWNKTFDIKKLPVGKWHIKVKAKDNMSNYSKEEAINIKIDPNSDIPILTVINPTHLGRVASNLRVVGTAFDDDEVKEIKMILNDETKERKCNGKEFWYYDLDTSQMEDGIHTLKFTVTDINDITSKELIVPFVLDRKTPELVFESVPEDVVISGKINISGIVTDGNGIYDIEYSTDNRINFNKVSGFKTNRDKTEANWNLQINSENLVDGVQTIWIKATDMAGSEGYESITVVVDHRQPIVKIQYPNDKDKVDGIFKVFGTVHDNVGIKKLTVDIKGASNRLSEIKLLPGNPFWHQNIDISDLKDGKYQVIASVEDISGNIINSTIDIEVIKDLDKPVLQLKSIKKGDKFSSNLPLFGKIYDDDEMESVLIKIIKMGSDETVFEDTIPSKYSFLYDIDLTDFNTFQEGAYKVELIPIDINGTNGKTVSEDFFIERSYPKFEEESISSWAGKSFSSKFSLNLNIIKYGNLKSVNYTLLDSNEYHELSEKIDIKFKQGKEEGIYECDPINIDLTKNENVNEGIVLVNLKATDDSGNTASINVPIIIDKTNPALTIPQIDKNTGLIDDAEIIIDENLILNNVKLTISSSEKDSTPIEDNLSSIGSTKEYELPVKNLEGKFNEYSVNLEAVDLAGNKVNDSFKIIFKETTEETHKLKIQINNNSNLIYSVSPKIFIKEKNLGLENSDSTIFGFFPANYNLASITYNKLNKKAQLINETNGIFIIKFNNDERNQMNKGSVPATIKLTSLDKKEEKFNITLFNDVSDPIGGIIWPLPYLPFNTNTSLYGKASDDSGEVNIEYITDESIPREIGIEEFENEIITKIPNNDIKRQLTSLFDKDKTIYKLKSDIEGKDLLFILETFDIANIDMSFKKTSTFKLDQANKIKIPLIEPLERNKSKTLKEFAAEHKNDISKKYNLFKIDLPLQNMEDGEHAVLIKLTDLSGRTTIKKGVFITDKTAPEINMWSLVVDKIEKKDNDKKEKKQKPDKKKEKKKKRIKNEDITKETEEITEESEIANEDNENKIEKINGEITLRGDAKDNIYLSDIVIIYNQSEVVASGKKIWESLYDLNKVKGLNVKIGEQAPHTIELFAIDLAGNKTLIKREVLVDKQQDIPEILINKPAIENQRFTGTIELAGIALDDDEVEYVQYRIDNNKNKNNWERLEINKSSGQWNRKIAGESLESGIHILEVQAIDIYGLKSTIEKIAFHVDKENPIINISSPRNGQYLKGDASIIGKSFDPNEIEKVEISTNYGWSFVKALGQENWNYKFDSKSVPDGPVRVLIKSKDKAGSEAFSFALYNVDNTKPEIDVLMPREGMKINNKFKIIGRAKDNIGIESVRLYINVSGKNKLPNTDKDGFVDAEGKEAWSLDIDTTNWETNKTYHLVAIVKDLSGNISEKSIDFYVDPLSDLPVVELIQPQPSQHLTGEIINFYGTAADDEDIHSVFIKIDDGEEIKVKGKDIWKYSLPTINLTPGKHTLSVYANEKKADGSIGKQSKLITRIFYFDESGPVINVVSHINGSPIEHRPWITGNTYYFEKDLILKLKKEIQEEKHNELKMKYRRTPELIPKIEDISVSKSEVQSKLKKHKKKNKINFIYMSMDNGKTFVKKRIGSPTWKIRMQTQYLENGPHMLQFKTVSDSQKESIEYFRVIIDRYLPEVIIDTPIENHKLNEQIAVRGSANDNGTIEEIKISLKRFDKNLGKIPKFVQGIYLWAQAFGGFWISGGFGLSFFDDIVRIEGVFGWTPTRENIRDFGTDPNNVPDGILRTSTNDTEYNPRYSGFVTGGKLLARIIDIPFEFFGGEDLKNFSITVSIGCGFYWVSGFGGAANEVNQQIYYDKRPDVSNPGYDPLEDGKVIAGFMYQIDLIRIERLGPFRKFAIYFENAFYFVASEIEGGLVPQIGFGIRNALF